MINTRQVILFFEEEIPEFVYFGWRRHRVTEYIPEPTRCYHCQGYGHKANRCNSRLKCPICSKNHTYEQCTAKEQDREQQRATCPNCKGPHPASYKGCPKYKQVKSIIKTQTTEKVSYAAAVRLSATRLQNVNDDNRVTNSNETITDLNTNRSRAAASDPTDGLIGEKLGTVKRSKNSDENVRSEKAPPNMTLSNQPNPDTENTQQQYVKIETLTDFFQSFTAVLLTGMSFSPDSMELIEKLATWSMDF